LLLGPGRAARSGWGTIVGLLGFITVMPGSVISRRRDSSAAALAMSSMHMNDMRRFWSFPLLQATGRAGLFSAYLGVVLGLFVSEKSVSCWGRQRVRAASRGGWHSFAKRQPFINNV
jgi:hypothetical protein